MDVAYFGNCLESFKSQIFVLFRVDGTLVLPSVSKFVEMFNAALVWQDVKHVEIVFFFVFVSFLQV